MASGRTFNQAWWCKHKHLNNAFTHTFETVQKFWRDDPSTGVAPGTREEANHALREIQALENHAAEIMNKADREDDKQRAREVGDEARRIRQELAQTGVPFKTDIDVASNAREKFEDALDDIDSLLEKVDESAARMEQEQIDCLRCEEDIQELADSLDTELKKDFINNTDGNTSIDNMVRTNQFQNPEGDELISMNIIGDNIMVNANDTKMLAVGAFGSKTLEEVTEAVETELAPNVQFGPLGVSNMANLAIGLGVPLAEIMGQNVSRAVGNDNALAAVSGSLNLLANELGDLTQEVLQGQVGGLSARSATVNQQSASGAQVNRSSKTTESSSNGNSGSLNVGQGSAAEQEQTSGLIVG